MRFHHWFLIIAIVLIVYVLFRGGEERFAPSQGSLDYNVVAVSDGGLTAEAQALNLEKDLDVALLPEIGKASVREAANKGLKEQAFLEDMLRNISNRVREVSTIDLNEDQVADPILVKPEPAGQEGYVLLSLRVPSPEAYPLPEAKDTQGWKGLETFEVATMSVALNDKELTVEAQGNRHVYPDSYQRSYVARDHSFLQTYMTIRMLDWMFFPRYYGFYGPGWGYGYYRPVPVAAVSSRRSGAVSSRGYQPAAGQASPAIRGRSGQSPQSVYSRANPTQPPRTLNKVRASRSFARRAQGGATGRGGFGRAGAQAARSTGSSRYATQRAAPRGWGGFGRGSSSRSFGGGGGRFGK